MVVSKMSLWDFLVELFEDEYDAAVVYGDSDGTEILHEGPVRVRASGWVRLPSGRLLSPDAVHHIDTRDP